MVGLTLCVVFLDSIVGIREGTILTAMLVGRLTGVIRKRISPLIRKVCFGKEA
jgi:uncharacterized membrane protein YczE